MGTESRAPRRGVGSAARVPVLFISILPFPANGRDQALPGRPPDAASGQLLRNYNGRRETQLPWASPGPLSTLALPAAPTMALYLQGDKGNPTLAGGSVPPSCPTP